MVFKYVCSGCGLHLLSSEELIDPLKIRLQFNSICPCCKTYLSNNVEFFQVKSNDSLCELSLCAKSSRHEKYPINFQKVNALQIEPRLFFGEEHMDCVLGSLRPGSIIFLYNSWHCVSASELLCVKVQFDSRHGGLDSDAIFIDGGNTFDFYLVAEYARRFSLNQDEALDRIFVSRVFNSHQLAALITRILPNFVHDRGIRLIVISDLIKLYLDSSDSQRLNYFRILISSLRTMARTARAIVLVTHLKERSESTPFLHIIKQQVDTVLRFDQQSRSIQLILEKHPMKSVEAHVMKNVTSRTLEDFLEKTNADSLRSNISWDNVYY